MKFNTDGPVWRFLGTLTDFTMLNAIFLITCIPVVTIGPAVCALYTVTLREARGEHGYMIRPYLTAFKENLKSGFLLSLIYVFLGGVLLFNFAFWLKLHTMMGNVILAILVFCAIIYILSLCYVFALNARFENGIKQTMKNSVLIALSSLPQTGLLLIILLFAGVVFAFAGALRVFYLIFGFAFIAYCQSFPLTKVFERFI